MSTSVSWHPYVAHNTEDPCCGGNRFWELVWKTAAIASIVALTALSLVAVVFAAMESPLMVPLVIAVILCVNLPAILQIYQYCMTKAEEYGNTVEFNNKIVAKMNALPADLSQLRALVEGFGVTTSGLSDQDLTTLKPAIAIAQVKSDRVTEWAAEVQKEFGKDTFICELEGKEVTIDQRHVPYLSAIDPDNTAAIETQGAVLARIVEHDKAENVGLIKKIQAAYCLHVLQAPHDLRPLSDFCSVYNMGSLQARLLVKERGDPSYNIFVKTKGQAPQAYTTDDIKQWSLAQIAETLFQLNQPPARGQAANS
jgi:hypothetical protein